MIRAAASAAAVCLALVVLASGFLGIPCSYYDTHAFGEFDHILANEIYTHKQFDTGAIERIEVYTAPADEFFTSLERLTPAGPLLVVTGQAEIQEFLRAMRSIAEEEPTGMPASYLAALAHMRDGRIAYFAFGLNPKGYVYVMPDIRPCEFGTHGADSAAFYDYLAARGLLPPGWDAAR